MNDEHTSSVEGKIYLEGININDKKVSPRLLRHHVGMVFQQPNPFACSIHDNVAFGLRLNGFKGDIKGQVEQSLKRAACWEDVKDKLGHSGLSLSGGQQQRLCIARAIATEPRILLMDEPCSALDPISTLRVEELMQELKKRYTIVVVTHNMEQAKRCADYVAYFYVDRKNEGGPCGQLVEYGEARQVMEDPRHELTKEYLGGHA